MSAASVNAHFHGVLRRCPFSSGGYSMGFRMTGECRCGCAIDFTPPYKGEVLLHLKKE